MSAIRLRQRCWWFWRVDFEQEEDGRWLADYPSIPGAIAYGATAAEAGARALALALEHIEATHLVVPDEDQEILVESKDLNITVPRGHCDRCDRCGMLFGDNGHGCQPGRCSQKARTKRLEHCPGCGFKYRNTRNRAARRGQFDLPMLSDESDDKDFADGKRSLHPIKLTLREKAKWWHLQKGWDASRPQTRGDCRHQQRPCPWVSCVHHLYLEVNEDFGTIRLNFPHIAPDQMDRMPATCSLDEAERKSSGLMALEQIGRRMGRTLESARQIQEKALAAVAEYPNGAEILAARVRLPVIQED